MRDFRNITSHIKLLLFLICFLFSGLASNAQRLRADQFAKILGRGIAAAPDFNDAKQSTLNQFKIRGFNHVRFRCDAAPDYISKFASEKAYFDNLENYVDRIIVAELIPVISWTHDPMQANPEDFTMAEFIDWWKEIANRMKDKPEDNIAFNLGTEFANKDGMAETTIYNEWHREAVKQIRLIDSTRIIILPSPDKEGTGLSRIASDIYTDDEYMMAEFHSYAAGPKSEGTGKPRNWQGTGSESDKDKVREQFVSAMNWHSSTGIPLYFGAWMPMGNKDVEALGIEDEEAQSFARFFMDVLEENRLPWAVNALQHFYDEDSKKWILTKQFPKPKASNDYAEGPWLDMPTLVDILTTYGNFRWDTISDDTTPSTNVTFDNEVFAIYPNPTSGPVNIKFENDKFCNGFVKVLNAYGAVLEVKLISYRDKTIIDLHNYSSGLYYIVISNNVEVISKAIIKE